MNITRLRLTNFKRHRALDVGFVPGLNVVRGSNEAGKSTVQRAVEMGLFRRPTTSSQDLDDTRPWRDGEADPVVEIEFEDEGRTGAVKKTFAGQRGTVELRLGDESITDPGAVEQQIAKLTGLPSEKFFRATASVHHQELGGLTQDESTLRDRLQQSMSGADRGTHAARRKLEEAIRRYRTEGAKNPGYLKVHRTEVDRLKAAVRQGEAALAELEADRRGLADARAARAALDAQLATERESVEKAERAVALAARAADAARRYATYKKAAELRAEIAAMEAHHPTRVPLATLRSTVERLRNLEFQLSEMRAELAAEPDLSGYDVAIPIPRWRPAMMIGVGLIVVGVVAAAAGLALGAMPIGLVVAAAFAAVGVAALLIAVRGRRRVSDICMQNELHESEIARRLTGRSDLAERARQVEQERTRALGPLGFNDVTTAETALALEIEHTAQIDERKAELRGHLGDANQSEDVVARRDEAAAEADQCRHALAGLGELGQEPHKQLAAHKLVLQRLNPQREQALQAEAQANGRVAANEVDAEQVAADAEALETAQEALAASERRVRIYEDVLTSLDNAERATMKKAARFLEQRMARDVDRVTGGRYRRLKVDEKTLTFTVFSPEMNNWVDVRQLSQGTLDQLYLCARLGIVRQVTEPANPPLIFDDPFITFDDERARRALSLLKEIARDYQVIYLTTSDRYDNQADNIVVLPAPLERDEPEFITAPQAPAETLSVWSTALLPTHEPSEPHATGNGNGRGAAKTPVATPRTSNAATPAAEEPAPVEHTPLWPEES